MEFATINVADVPATPVDLSVRHWPGNGKRAHGAPRTFDYGDDDDSALIFDTETTGTRQELLFGVWRLILKGELVEEGIFYPDILPASDIQFLRDYARATNTNGRGRYVRLITVTQWLDSRLYAKCYRGVRKRGTRLPGRVAIVGHNLPFDLSRIAASFGVTRKRGVGEGFLFRMRETDSTDPGNSGRAAKMRYRPDIRIVKVGDYFKCEWAAMTEGDDPEYFHGAQWKGRFIDTSHASAALTGRRKRHTLEGACKEFGIPFTKADVQYGTLSTALIDYARADVEATEALYYAIRAELLMHSVPLEIDKLFSGASVAKAYMRAMNVRPPEIADDVQRRGAVALYGGQAEAPAIRVEVPVAVLDWQSMYPTCAENLGVWELLTAESVTYENVTQSFREFLAAPNLMERALDPETWREWGTTIVDLTPDGDILPYRYRMAEYSKIDLSKDEQRLAINPLTVDGVMSWAWADVAASVIRTGKVPEIIDATRVQPIGKQPDLRPVSYRGTVAIDPSASVFAPLVKARIALASSGGADAKRSASLLKVITNTMGHGLLAEFNTVRMADGSKHDQPGAFCSPVIDAAIMAGARLILAMAETLIGREQGAWAFCDTDSMAIMATPNGGPITVRSGNDMDGYEQDVNAMSWEWLRHFIGRFERLASGDFGWKVEHETMTDPERPVYAYVVQSKNYALFRRDSNGSVEILDAKESGLGGVYTVPIDGWIQNAWKDLLENHGTLPDDESTLGEWAAYPELRTDTLNTPTRWKLRNENHAEAFGGPLRPFTFFSSATVETQDGATHTRFPALLGPYGSTDLRAYREAVSKRPAKRNLDPGNLRFRILSKTVDDLATNGVVRAFAPRTITLNTAKCRCATLRIETEGETRERLRMRACPDCGEPFKVCSITCKDGLLRRKHVMALSATTRTIGKEGNSFLDRREKQVTAQEATAMYAVEWETLRPALLKVPVKRLAALSGLSEKTVSRAISGTVAPRKSTVERLRRGVIKTATDVSWSQWQRSILPVLNSIDVTTVHQRINGAYALSTLRKILSGRARPSKDVAEILESIAHDEIVRQKTSSE